jgi:hypothetical protein
MNYGKMASRIAEGWQDQLQGGLADEKTPQNFDPQALIKGLVVELEHVNKEAHELLKQNPEAIHTAIEIAMDHLTEDPEYYNKLAVMEGESSAPPPEGDA